MTSPESPSLLLQRAADKLERRAEAATEGPWRASGFEIYPADVTEDPIVEVGFESGGFTREEDAAWAAMANPLWAAPLVAWLREAASSFEAYGGMPPGLMQSDEVAGTYGHTYRFMHGAMEFAQLVLGFSAEGKERRDP